MKKTIAGFIALVSCSQIHSSNVQWSFPPTILSSTTSSVTDPHIAISTAGNVACAWVENGMIKARAKHIGFTWGSVTTLSGSGASFPRLVSDPSGNATLVWVENGIVKVAIKPVNESWHSATSLSGHGASSPALAVSSTSDVIVAWARNGNIETATKLFGQNWQPRETIHSSHAVQPSIAIGGQGSLTKAAVVWQGTSGSVPVIFASVQLLSGSWNGETIISDKTHAACNSHVAVDPAGNAVALWYQYDAAGSLYSNVAVASSTRLSSQDWEAPTVLSEPGIRNPSNLVAKVAFDAAGNAIALWNTSFDDAHFTVQSAILPSRGQWSPATDLVLPNLFASRLDASATQLGEVLALYSFYDGTSLQIQSTETYIDTPSGNSWSVPLTLSANSKNTSPSVSAMLSSNVVNAASVWISSSGTNNQILASLGSKTFALPPTNLSVVQHTANYGVFTDCYNALHWAGSPDPSVQGYLIFRDGIFLAQVDANVLQYEDHNRVPSQHTTYSLAAFNAQGDQSPLATVNFP